MLGFVLFMMLLGLLGLLTLVLTFAAGRAPRGAYHPQGEPIDPTRLRPPKSPSAVGRPRKGMR